MYQPSQLELTYEMRDPFQTGEQHQAALQLLFDGTN